MPATSAPTLPAGSGGTDSGSKVGRGGGAGGADTEAGARAAAASAAAATFAAMWNADSMIGASGASSAAGGGSGTAAAACKAASSAVRRRVAGGGTMASSSRARRRPGCARVPPEGLAGGASSGADEGSGTAAVCAGASASTNTKRKGLCSTAPSRMNCGRCEAGRARQIAPRRRRLGGTQFCALARCRVALAHRGCAAERDDVADAQHRAAVSWQRQVVDLQKNSAALSHRGRSGGPTALRRARARGAA